MHLSALGQQPRGDDRARSLAHVVRARFEGHPQQGDLLVVQSAQFCLQTLDVASRLELVDLDDRGQQLEGVTVVGGERTQCAAVLRETGAAVAETGLHEVRADPRVQADRSSDLGDVGAGRLTHGGQLVHQRNLCRECRVRAQLRQLGRRDIHENDRPIDTVVQLRDEFRCRILPGADDHTVRVHEVRDRLALGGELGVGGIADMSKTCVVQRGTDARTGPDRHRRLHDHRGQV